MPFRTIFHPLGFAEALSLAEDEISAGMPEWIEIHEGFYLEDNLTYCLFEWEWLKFKELEEDAFAFAEHILDLEDSFTHVALNDNTFLDFFTQLPETDQEIIFKGLTRHRDTPPWKKWLDNTGILISRYRAVGWLTLLAWTNPQAGLDYTDVPPSATSPFEATVDIKRVFNDPSTQATFVWPHMTSESCNCPCICLVCGEYTHEACLYVRNGETGAVDTLYAHLAGSVWTTSCSCACTSPEIVRVYYKAGVTTLTKQAEDAIIHLAHAKMPRPSCGCGILRDKWDIDRKIPDKLTAERINCPFGMEDGAFKAYKFAMAMRSIRLAIL